MAQTKTRSTLELEEAPQGAPLSVIEDEDAHYLRVTLDKSENFKVAAGQKLVELLKGRFRGNRNALRDWYEAEVVQGKEHRKWTTVEEYLGAVRKHGDNAENVLAERHERDIARDRARHERDRQDMERGRATATNEINDLAGKTTTRDLPDRQPKSEYEQRQQWLGNMDYLWFKGKKEWQKRWLDQRWNELLTARNG